jgi:rhodanese-related sulfurtransferase
MRAAVEELSPQAFRERWPETKRDEVQLLDVREAAELDIAALPRVVHIPMLEISARLGELDPERPVVVMCHTGVRSRHVAGFLVANEFKQVCNLAGGIDAWSTQLDPELPRY